MRLINPQSNIARGKKAICFNILQVIDYIGFWVKFVDYPVFELFALGKEKIGLFCCCFEDHGFDDLYTVNLSQNILFNNFLRKLIGILPSKLRVNKQKMYFLTFFLQKMCRYFVCILINIMSIYYILIYFIFPI